MKVFSICFLYLIIDPELLSHLRAPTNILIPPIGQKSTSLLSHLLLIIISPARFFGIVVCLYVCMFFSHVFTFIVLYSILVLFSQLGYN